MLESVKQHTIGWRSESWSPTNYQLNSWFTRCLLHKRLNDLRNVKNFHWSPSSSSSCKPVPPFTLQAEEFQELGEAQTIGNVPLWPSWRVGEKKNVIKHFVDALEPHCYSRARGGIWNRPNRACNYNAPCDREGEGEALMSLSTPGEWSPPLWCRHVSSCVASPCSRTVQVITD